jgi:hypothetical protein
MDLFLDFIDFNETVNYLGVVYCLIGYLLLFWLAMSAWVAKDSYKRYEGSRMAALVWFLIVLVLNFPGFMFYMIVRPEERDLNSYFGGGVNIPIANFVNKEGDYLMGLQLKINNTEITEQVRDMNLSLDWDSKDPNKQMSTEAIQAEEKEVRRRLDRLREIIKKFAKRRREQLKQRKVAEEQGAENQKSNKVIKEEKGKEKDQEKAEEAETGETSEKQEEVNQENRGEKKEEAGQEKKQHADQDKKPHKKSAHKKSKV